MIDESTCDRLRGARERLGLTPEEVASKVGLSAAWYYDLEAYPDEMFSTLSLAHLQALGRALGLDPKRILFGDTASPDASQGFRDVVDALERRMKLEGLDAETLGERLGWDIRDVLTDPEELWNFNVTGLRDVCLGAGVDWLAVLTHLDDLQREMHPQVVTGLEKLGDLFSILHDGAIVQATTDGPDLVLQVEITYLAARIQQGLTTFGVRLSNVEDLRFATWPNDPRATANVLCTVTEIFVPPLDILSGKVVAGRLEVACNQSSPESHYCGGTLSFRAASAVVSDQNGKHHSLAQLRALAEGYWKDWSQRSSKA
jgi:transcriptional regulator with XRE-family HTH domain